MIVIILILNKLKNIKDSNIFLANCHEKYVKYFVTGKVHLSFTPPKTLYCLARVSLFLLGNYIRFSLAEPKGTKECLCLRLYHNYHIWAMWGGGEEGEGGVCKHIVVFNGTRTPIMEGTSILEHFILFGTLWNTFKKLRNIHFGTPIWNTFVNLEHPWNTYL